MNTCSNVHIDSEKRYKKRLKKKYKNRLKKWRICDMKKKFILEGLGCANCASKMEVAINKLEGVKEATVNFMTQKLVIDADEDKMAGIIAESEKIVRRIESDTRMNKA